MKKRPLDELLDKKEPAWPTVCEWTRKATNHVEVLPPDPARRADTLVSIQVTTRSPMGAIVYESGGMLVDHGWLRILGSGHPRLPRSLADWNRERGMTDEAAPPSALLVADDVLGGFLALNGGAFPSKPGSVFYFAPDSLDWEDMTMGYSDFVAWALSGNLDKFYETSRWPGWPEEVSAVPGDRAIMIYPFLWAKGDRIADRSRRAVPVAELFDLQMHLRSQMGSANQE
ncbi:MAG: DUF2625 domain-containing protein [Polyangiaceae bacterium]|nr:DUF2625 domain-containing protein [Polyangiaceae bacterium]